MKEEKHAVLPNRFRHGLVPAGWQVAVRIAVIQLTLLPGFNASAVEATLRIGTLKTAASDTTIELSLSDALAGGTGKGCSYDIYRDTRPHFVPGNTNLLATVTNLAAAPYADQQGLESGVMYYYKVIGRDDGGHAINAIPEGLGHPDNTLALSVPASLKDPHLNIVYIGDSISEAGGLADRAHQAPPAVCSQALSSLMGLRDVYMSNQGHSGATTVDFLPDTHVYFAGVEKAARNLADAHPGLLVFSVMLGANDSANTVTRGAPVSADTYYKNLKTIIERLLADFPDSRIFLHQPTWYSPNTHNSADYEESGLERLTTFFEKINALVAAYDQSRPGHVFLGDQIAYRYFAANYLTAHSPQQGRNGTFYLHPNLEGSAELGRLWAEAIASRLYTRKE